MSATQTTTNIQTQAEAIKLQSTREILKQYQNLQLQNTSKNRRIGNSKTTLKNNLDASTVSKISKLEEQLKTKLWKIWIDQTEENRLRSELLLKMIIEIKSNLGDIIQALRGSNLSEDILTVLHFLIENKLAKINGFKTVTDQQIFYTNSSGQTIPIGNLELTEIEIDKQKVYVLGFRTVNKIGEITQKELEVLTKFEVTKANEYLNILVDKIKIL